MYAEFRTLSGVEPPSRYSKIHLVYFRASEGKVLNVWGLSARLSRAMAADVGTIGWVAQLMDHKSN